MQELCHIRHYGPFIRFVHVHILSVQQPGDAQSAFSHVERVLQSLSVCLPFHLSQVDEVCFDGVNDGQEGDTVAPGRAEVCYLDVGIPG